MPATVVARSAACAIGSATAVDVRACHGCPGQWREAGSASLYQQAMGARFADLSPAVQRFHTLQGRHALDGWVEVDAPSSWPARWMARLSGAPTRAGSGALLFELDAAPEAEIWTRRFPGQRMRSRFNLDAGWLAEQLGPARMRFCLRASEGRLEMRLQGLRVMGVPCPRWLLPRLVAEEYENAGRLHFSVQVAWPRIGTVASYRGHLTLDESASS